MNAKLRLEIYKRDEYQCKFCQSSSRLTIDHIIPLDKGGGNELSNLQTLCYRCNQEKGNHIKKWWHKLLPFLTRLESNKLRNEMLWSMKAKDGMLESKLDKRITELKPKIDEYIDQKFKSIVTSNNLGVVGLQNSTEAMGKRSKERDRKLLGYMRMLAERIDELENKIQ